MRGKAHQAEGKKGQQLETAWEMHTWCGAEEDRGKKGCYKTDFLPRGRKEGVPAFGNIFLLVAFMLFRHAKPLYGHPCGIFSPE